MYQIILNKQPKKFIDKLPPAQRERIVTAIEGLPDNGDIKPMSGHANLYRLRVGTFRVIYTIENDVFIIRVITIGNRGDVYK